MFSRKAALMALALAGCTPDDAASGQDSAITVRFQEHLDALHAAGMVGVVGEVDNGSSRIQAHSGVAQLGSELPVALDSRFRIGSNTKTFVAVVILQLAHEGALTLDDSVDKWLPGLVSGNGNDGKRITIRQLLQHTSGIHNYLQDLLPTFTPDQFPTLRLEHHDPEELVAIALQHAPEFAPGTSWGYSNTNYILAGMIIEKVTGNDWRSEVHTRIAVPLNLSNTGDPVDDPDLPPPHANGYQRFVEGGPLTDVTLMNQSMAGAAGSLISTTSDLTQFWRALQSGKLLGPAEMAEMHDTVPATEYQDVYPGERYGLGIMWFPTSCGVGLWTHIGDTLGFANFNAVNDDGTRAVVVSQTTMPEDFAVFKEDFQLLDDVMCAGH